MNLKSIRNSKAIIKALGNTLIEKESLNIQVKLIITKIFKV